MKWINNLNPILSGLEIGIPLNLISKIATDNTYLNCALTKESIIINFLLGFTAYKQDRYLDSLEYFSRYNNFSNIKKYDYYNSLVNNKKIIELTLFCSYITIAILFYLSNNDLKTVLSLFSTTFLYKYFKQNKKLSILKPFYVASMWTLCTCIIPLLVNSNFDFTDVSIPLVVPTFLNLFSLTNFADLKDYNEDLNNNINTIPVVLGKQNSKNLIIFTSLISSILFINSPFYINNIQNILYLSSNIFPYVSLFNNTTL